MLRVIIQSLDQSRVIAGAGQQVLQSRQRVLVAGNESQDFARRPGARVDIVQALVVDDQQASEQTDFLLLGRHDLDLTAQRAREAGKVRLFLVNLHQRAHRHLVVRGEPQDLLIDLERALRGAQFLALDLGDAAQDLDLLRRLRRSLGFALENRNDPVEALRLQQDPFLHVAGTRRVRIQLLDAAPGHDGAFGIGQVLLGDGRDLF